MVEEGREVIFAKRGIGCILFSKTERRRMRGSRMIGLLEFWGK